MSVTKFRFVSPGVFVNEIDNSQRPKPSDPIGPVIIGRTERGPTMRPVRINSFSDFIEVFGAPIAGQQGDDVWRQGNYVGPTYAAYAAQAWLRNTNACTVVRLAGVQHSDATAGGAGAAGWKTGHLGTNYGAWGLFLVPSASSHSDKLGHRATGTLAAIWYSDGPGVQLKGTVAGGSGSSDLNSATLSGSGVLIESSGDNSQFTCQIVSGAVADAGHNRHAAGATTVFETKFNFDRTSPLYIRNVFNTNPMLTNTRFTDSDAIEQYWLGETYDRSVADIIHSVSSSAGKVYGWVMPVKAQAASLDPSNMKIAAKEAMSGWVISQDLSTNSSTYQPNTMTKLFRLVTLNYGEWEQQNLKVSIQNIKASTNDYDKYGTFDVVIRKANDTDATVRTVERFSSCNLNPYSSNYIGRQIGTQYLVWSDTEKRYKTFGDHPNASKFIRVEVNSQVEKGTANPLLLPYGFIGPTKWKDLTVVGMDTFKDRNAAATDLSDSGVNTLIDAVSGSDASLYSLDSGSLLALDLAEAAATQDNGEQKTTDKYLFAGGAGSDADEQFACKIKFPQMALRTDALDAGLPNPKDVYFGVDSGRSGSTLHEESYEDYVRPKPGGNSHTAVSNATEISFWFSLDDVKPKGAKQEYVGVYSSGSRAAGNSYTAASASYKEVLDMGYDSFTMPLFGGYDGLDITEAEPFNDGVLTDGTELGNAKYYAIKRAIDTCADPEEVQFDLMVCPGLRHTGLTSHMINTCEARGDAMAIIDIEQAYTPRTESTNAASARGANVDSAVTKLQNRGLNSSYGTCYFPWVQIRDTMTGQSVWAPPSIVALGSMSYGQKSQELWFAPAGFTRGGLTEGRGGLPVTAVSHKLTSKERDKLYDANINPIAQFPNEGIVIFGQKTLQVTPSALDRINVRRLMIYVKREIARMAATLLFDQNVTSTWNKFLSQVNPFLGSIKGRLGLMDFKVVLDSTTTTPDLIDRNIMYAKIF
ncbi:MAG: hypothetical protein CMQ51_05535, partial [Gammaproteobacteria bacterium]|nr:hypothetical protein [Gammaproteobacteria bacterium]